MQVTAEPASTESAGIGAIEIELATGARMRITGAVDKATLSRALRSSGLVTETPALLNLLPKPTQM
jgi:hypothetical protein